MHSLSAMILKYQQGKQEARLRRMRAGLPHSPRDRGRISGFHNFTIYAILYSGREKEKEKERQTETEKQREREKERERERERERGRAFAQVVKHVVAFDQRLK